MLMLHRMTRVPMWFYDTTPVGRIMSRFSKDIETVDQKIVEVISDGLWCALEVNVPDPILVLAIPCLPAIIINLETLYSYNSYKYQLTNSPKTTYC